MKLTLNIIALLLLTFFTGLMINITVPYFSFEDHTAFLRIKQWVIDNQVWKAAFYVHVITSCFCLIAGFTQFSNSLLKKHPKIHRWMGVLYVGVILLFSGSSGIIMSFYANGGLISQIAFMTLSILWLTFTFLGFYHIKSGNIKSHQKYMLRSYALTLSALTLRAWKLGIVLLFRPHPMDAYMIVAWLGWVPNLIVIEAYIKMKFSREAKLS